MPSNRLSQEKSPYLLQHANNPVDWYAWGPEAFAKARDEDKPIFLSIGYSTCHWCHVMERESFENEQIAAAMNQFFVPVKVDREERPDVDRIYMLFVQATTGSGGWPMSVFLTPDLQPFYGGTYFPPDNRYGRPGFGAILQHLGKAWGDDREAILKSGASVMEQLKAHVAGDTTQVALQKDLLDTAFSGFKRSFDSEHGGFGGAPKFPRPSVHNFLLRYYQGTKNREALEMVLQTLREMAKGGMNDQLGGGFHRYSVDERWFVPHFEKMLYDQAQLAISYLEAFQITRENYFAEVAHDIFEYIIRDMTAPDGGFYSAEDADSVVDPEHPHEKAEGAFYVWTRKELNEILGEPAADWFAYHYGVGEHGNVDSDPHGEFGGKNILYEAHAVEETALRFKILEDEVISALDEAKIKLMEARSLRVRPHLDDKILTSWNGLMISAFAKGAQILDEPKYLESAARATEFILKNMYNPETVVLLRRFRDGDAAIPAFLDDYAFFIQGLLDLYEANFQVYHLDLAVQLTAKMIELFGDGERGGFFSAAEGDSSLLMRLKDDYDGAEPSGNSVAALVLLRLARMADKESFREQGEGTLQCFSQGLSKAPFGMPQMLAAYMLSLSSPRQIVIASDGRTDEFSALLDEVRLRFLPNAVILAIDGAEAREGLSRYSTVFGEMTAPEGTAAAYVCENFACQLPVTEAVELAELLQ